MLNLTTVMNFGQNRDYLGIWDGLLCYFGLRLACEWFLCIALALCGCLGLARMYTGVDAVNGTRFTCFNVSPVLSTHSGGADAGSRLYRVVDSYSVLYVANPS